MSTAPIDPFTDRLAKVTHLKPRQSSGPRSSHHVNGEANQTDNKKRPDEYTLAELQHREFASLKWIVPDILVEGLSVFAGKPKIGKSWFMLGVALAVARGTETLGRLVEQGDVLYCGLEDNERRMKERVTKILGPAANRPWPEGFTIWHRLEPLDMGGLARIREYLETHPKRRLVAIDTFGKVKGQKKRDEEPYLFDYRLVSSLQELATEFGVAIVLVHHVRKSVAEDVLDTINGTTGIAGAADTGVVLGMNGQGTGLYVRGRDVTEFEKMIEFDPETGLWELGSDIDDSDPTSGRQGLRLNIHQALAASLGPMTPKEIASRVGANSGLVRRKLYDMVRARPAEATRAPDRHGAYRAAPHS